MITDTDLALEDLPRGCRCIAASGLPRAAAAVWGMVVKLPCKPQGL